MEIETSEVIEHPLDADSLSVRWRELLDDPRFSNFVGKLDLDRWGRIKVSPVNTEHGRVSARLAHILIAQLGGQALVEVGVRTAEGIFAPDVAWCSEAFWQAHASETPLQVSPEIVVEVASPSNTLHDLRHQLPGVAVQLPHPHRTARPCERRGGRRLAAPDEPAEGAPRAAGGGRGADP